MDFTQVSKQPFHATLMTSQGCFPVITYTISNFGLNGIYNANLQIFISKALDKHKLLHNQCYLRVLNKSYVYLPFDITHIHMTNSKYSKHLVSLKLMSPIKRLNKRKKNIIYQNKSLCQIIETLFQQYGLVNINIKGCHAHLKLLIQYDETDLDLLFRLVWQYGLCFYFNIKKGYFEINDAFSLSQSQKISEFTQTSERFITVKRYFLSLPNTISASATNPDNIHQVFKATVLSKSLLKGYGDIKLQLPLPIRSTHMLVYQLELLMQQLDCLRYLYVIETNDERLFLAHSVNLTIKGIRKRFNIISSVTIVDNHQSLPNPITHHKQKHIYIYLLIPAEIIFKQLNVHLLDSYFVKRLRTILVNTLHKDHQKFLDIIIPKAMKSPVPHFIRGTVVDIGKAPANQHNQYQVKLKGFSGDNIILMDKVALFCSTYPVGTYLPLYANSIVCVGFLNDNLFHPIILGCLGEAITHEDKDNDVVIQSKRGLMTHISNRKENIILSEPQNKHSIALSGLKHLSAIKLNAERGDIKIYTRHTLNITTTRLKITTKNFNINTKELLSITANNGSLVTKSFAASVKHQIIFSSQHMMFTTKSLAIKASNSLNIVTNEKLSLRGKKIFIDGRATLQANNCITINSGGLYLSLSKNGQITTNSQIKIIAPIHIISKDTIWLNPS